MSSPSAPGKWTGLLRTSLKELPRGAGPLHCLLCGAADVPPPHSMHCPAEPPSILPMLREIVEKTAKGKKRTPHNLRLRSRYRGFASIFETWAIETPDMFCETCSQTWTVCAIGRCLANMQQFLGEESVHNPTFRRPQTRTNTTQKYNERRVQTPNEIKPPNTEYPGNTVGPPLRLAATKRLTQLHNCARHQDMQQQARRFHFRMLISHAFWEQGLNKNTKSPRVLFHCISMRDRSPYPRNDLLHALLA